MDNVLVLGSGGREHALAEKIKRDEAVKDVFCAPGNGGTALSNGITNIEYTSFEELANKVSAYGINLIVVGPEKPLADGVADFFAEKDVSLFGFRRATARLEASKGYADQFKKRYGVLSPGFELFRSFGEAESYLERRFAGEGADKLWVKADELCGGKGVIGVENVKEGTKALTTFFEEKKCGVGDKVIIQDHIPGEEITVQAVTDGSSFALTPSSQDHKPLYDGGKGPNTGGMGAYAPAPAFDQKVEEVFKREILTPTADGLKEEGLGGPGVIYFGLGLSESGDPKVLEYNVRFGDPEAQTVLRLLDSELYPILKAAADERLKEVSLETVWKGGSAVCIVLAVDGYPLDYGSEEHPIEGINKAEQLPGVRVYHSGTRIKDEAVYTNGGRILSVTARGSSVADAQKKAYEAVDRIHFQGLYYRRDIGDRALD